MPQEFEFVFEPQDEGGYHVYAPDLPGLRTQGEDLDDAITNAQEAFVLYVEGIREHGGTLDTGVVRRRLPVRREREAPAVDSGAQLSVRLSEGIARALSGQWSRR